MSIEIELRFPTVAYGYANVKVSGDHPADVLRELAASQKAIGTAIQLAGGGDSHAQAERLLREELGAVKINEDGTPWSAPAAPVSQPWESGPPVESAGQPPFGGDPFAGAAASDPFAAPPRDYFFIDVPTGGLDAWKELRKTLNGSLPRGTIDWDADAKRNTIKKSAPQNILDGLRQRGYVLR